MITGSPSARRVQFGRRPRAAGILADYDFDAARRHQPPIALDIERPTVDHEMMTRQPWRLVRHIDEPQQIVVLRLLGERIDMHPPQRQHHAPRWPVQRRHRSVDIGHARPPIASDRQPRRPCQCNICDTAALRRDDRVRAHPGRERVRRVDHMRHALLAQIRDQSLDAAKPANAHRDRLSFRFGDAPGIAQHRIGALCRQRRGKCAGLGRAAQHQDVRHG